MTANEMESGIKNGADKTSALAGEALDAPDLEDRVYSAESQVQGAIDQMQERISQAADKVASTAVKLGEQAKDTYANVTIRVQKVADQVDPFVKEQPYLALGLAAVGGLMFGLLYAGRGPKIVYVKQPRV